MRISVSEFGAFLRGLAEKETAVHLAERLSISRSTLYDMMDRPWPSRPMARVCEILGVQLDVPTGTVRRKK